MQGSLAVLFRFKRLVLPGIITVQFLCEFRIYNLIVQKKRGKLLF